MSSLHDLTLIALLILGLAQLFRGYRSFRILIGVIGALIGFFYAPEIIALVTGSPPPIAVAIAIGAVLAVAFALVAWHVFWIAAFAWGATFGYAAGVTLNLQPWLALVIALVVGALAVLFQRALIVLLTALNGAWLVVASIAFLFGHIASPPRGLAFDPLLDFREPVAAMLIIITLALAVVGAVYQFRDAGPMLGRKR